MLSRRGFFRSLAVAGLAAVARIYTDPRPLHVIHLPRTPLPDVKWGSRFAPDDQVESITQEQVDALWSDGYGKTPIHDALVDATYLIDTDNGIFPKGSMAGLRTQLNGLRPDVKEQILSGYYK